MMSASLEEINKMCYNQHGKYCEHVSKYMQEQNTRSLVQWLLYLKRNNATKNKTFHLFKKYKIMCTFLFFTERLMD